MATTDTGYTVTMTRDRSWDAWRVRCFYCAPDKFGELYETVFENWYDTRAEADREANELVRDFRAVRLS